MQADPNDINTLVHAAMPSSTVDLVGLLVPIVAIVFGIGIGMLSLYLDFRKKREMFQLYHAERMAAIEKGIELPPLPDQFFGPSRNREPLATRHRRRGLILVFVGIAIVAAMWGTGEKGAWWGLVPIGLGAAYLLSSLSESRQQKPPHQG